MVGGNEVETGQELKTLANSIIDSYEGRVRTVNGLMEQAYGFLRSFQMELEEMIERLRDNLAKGESLRKADFDRMMTDLSESRFSHQLIAEDVLSRFQKEEMEMIDRLRKIVISGSRSNLKDMEVIRDDILILIRFQVETNYPRPSGQASQRLRVGRQPRQACFELTNDPLHCLKNPVGKLLLPQFIPDMFLWVEFRRVSR